MTETDLDAVRYMNGMTRNTVETWLRQAEIQVLDGTADKYDRRIIDLCVSWLDIEQQLVETKARIAGLEK